MKYNPPHDNVLCAVTYGSHLYGTSNPKSDHDFKAVYLPSYRELLLARTPRVFKYRFDAEGNPVSDEKSMPDNGYEAEHTPVQKFVRDWLGGQAYAVEMVFAVLSGYAYGHVGWGENFESLSTAQRQFYELCNTLATKFRTKNVQGMTGFAMKQTFDYVRRGERLNSAKAILDKVERVLVGESYKLGTADDKNSDASSKLRLDSKTADGETYLMYLAAECGLETGQSQNQNKTMWTLKLNGREYLETTTLVNFKTALEKMVDQYGERSTRASETDVDWKSLGHAVRVYQQVLELLNDGVISFPRPNADFLLQVRMGQVPLEQVKELLRELDDEVQVTLEASTLPNADEAKQLELEDVLYDWLEGQY